MFLCLVMAAHSSQACRSPAPADLPHAEQFISFGGYLAHAVNGMTVQLLAMPLRTSLRHTRHRSCPALEPAVGGGPPPSSVVVHTIHWMRHDIRREKAPSGAHWLLTLGPQGATAASSQGCGEASVSPATCATNRNMATCSRARTRESEPREGRQRHSPLA